MIRSNKVVPSPHFPLRRLALCLDCDECFEIAGACPACGSETLAPLARFLNVAGASEATRRSDTRSPRHVIVVARQHRDLYEYLVEALAGNESTQVVLDRRTAERRPPDQPRRRGGPARARRRRCLAAWRGRRGSRRGAASALRPSTRLALLTPAAWRRLALRYRMFPVWPSE
jgi:hypothetical protein